MFTILHGVFYAAAIVLTAVSVVVVTAWAVHQLNKELFDFRRAVLFRWYAAASVIAMKVFVMVAMMAFGAMPSFELLYVKKGSLEIEEEGQEFHVDAEETLLLWPDREHGGIAPPLGLAPFLPAGVPFEEVRLEHRRIFTEDQVGLGQRRLDLTVDVLGQVVAGITVDDLRVGMPVEMVLDTLYEDDDREYVVWKWKPVGAGKGRS